MAGHRTYERHLAGEVGGLDDKHLDRFVENLKSSSTISLLQAVLRRVAKERGDKLHLMLDREREALILVQNATFEEEPSDAG